MSLFGRSAKSVIGVDIGASSVKVVALTQHKEQPVLDGFALVSLPSKAFVDGNISQPDVIAEAIQRALKISGIKTKEAIAAVSASDVITKEIQISDAFFGLELEEQVRIEADQFIPYPLDEVALDFEIIGPAPTNPAFNRINIVACRRDDVDAIEDVLTLAGLKPEVVDVDTYVMERIVNRVSATDESSVAIVDLGAASLSLSVIKNGNLQYHREQAFGGHDLIHQLQLHIDQSEQDIDQMLRDGSIAAELLTSVVEPFASTIAQQVSRALQFYYSSGSQDHIGKILLTGGLSGVSALVQKVADTTGTESQLADPFAFISLGASINGEQLATLKPSLTKSLGLAFRGLEAKQ